METWKAKLQSRKFWLTIGVVVITILNQTMALGLDDAAVATLAASVAAWMFGETALDRQRIAADQQVAFKTLQAEAQAVVGRLQEDLQKAAEIINTMSASTGASDTGTDLSDI